MGEEMNKAMNIMFVIGWVLGYGVWITGLIRSDDHTQILGVVIIILFHVIKTQLDVHDIKKEVSK